MASAIRPDPERAAGLSGVPHGFFGRAGGCSPPPWEELNLSDAVGDRPAHVERNWRAVLRALGLSRVVRLHQIHGAEIRTVSDDDAPDGWTTLGEADGLLTTARGVGLAIMTADCVPILMAAPQHDAVMALHAGWRGTVAGIAAAGLARARDTLGIPEHAWSAALGPAIDQCCYQVATQIGADLENRWGAMPDAWRRTGERGHLGLRRANANILARNGVSPGAIELIGGCTSCSPGRYFSHRASGGRAGRQASIIAVSI